MRYYSTQRPVTPGAYPSGHKVAEIHNFPERVFCEEIGRDAWGYIDFAEAIPEDEATRYELVAVRLKSELFGVCNVLSYKKAPDALPCPFCGGSEICTYKYVHHPGAIRYGIVCTGCMASIDPGWAQTPHTVLDMWNKRKC